MKFALLALQTATEPGTFESVQTSLTTAFSNIYAQTIDHAPRVFAALVVLVVGYLVARLVARAITTVGDKLGLQRAAEHGGLAESMKQVGIQRSVPAIVGIVAFWSLMLVFLMSASNVLGIEQFSAAVQGLVAYVPNLIKALVVLFVGLLVASFLRGLIATSGDRVGISYAQQLGNACYWVLVPMTIIAAMSQFEIQFELLNQVILIAFAAIGVAFGLAVGLGGRDVVAGILAGYYLRQRVQAGDHVSVGSIEGTVRDVGPVATIVETVEDGLMNRRSVPNVKMLNEAVR
jgi:hypothetical protein